MIKVENHEVTMFGELEELSAEITLLMATHYQAMVKHWGEGKANLWLASMGRYAVSPDALEGVKSYEEHVIPVVKKMKSVPYAVAFCRDAQLKYQL